MWKVAAAASIELGPLEAERDPKEAEMNNLTRVGRACVAALVCAVAVLATACNDTAPNASSPPQSADTEAQDASSVESQPTDDITTSPAPSAEFPQGGKVVATIPIPEGYGGFTLGEGAVWAMSDLASTLSRIDPQGNAVVARIKVKPVKPCPPYVCGEPGAGNGAVWVPRASDDTVSRIDLSTNRVTATIPVGSQPTAIAVTPGAVWVANSGGPSISRIDPATNEVVATIRIGPAGGASDFSTVTAGGGVIWASVPTLGAVVRIDPATNAVTARIRVPHQPCGFLAADEHAVWASGASCGGGVTRIDPRTKKPAGKVTGFLRPIGLALGFGSLWVADIDRKSIDRVNPRTGRIVARLPVGGIPIRLAVGSGSVWVRDDTGRVLRIKPQG